MPQPLSTIPNIEGNYSIQWGADTLPKRPRLAQLIAQVITEFSHIELWQNIAVSRITGTENKTAFIVFSSIKNNRAKQDALSEAADEILSGGLKRVFDIGIESCATASKYRDRFAHHIWGICDQVPDGLILIKPLDHVRFMRKGDDFRERMRSGQPPPDPKAYADAYRMDLKNVLVYKESDLKEALDQVHQCNHIWGLLCTLLDDTIKDVVTDARQYRELLTVPLFCEAKSRLSHRNAQTERPG